MRMFCQLKIRNLRARTRAVFVEQGERTMREKYIRTFILDI